MQVDRHIFIINPAAGKSNRSYQLAAQIALQASDVEHEIHITKYPRHACLLVQQSAEKYSGERLRFYACGGDGTLNEVGTTAVSVENCSFTHFPSGSGNDFIKIFGAENTEKFTDLRQLICADEIELDYIESDCGISLNVFSAGIDARIAFGMQKYKRIPVMGGHSAYMAATVENIIRGLHDPYRVEIGGEVLDGRYTLILAANGRCYGGGYYAVPDADPADGLLDILLVRDLSRFEASKAISAYKAGKYRELPQFIKHRRAKEMTIVSANSAKAMTINFDGEIEHSTRVSLRVAQRKMRFAVPQGVRVCPAGQK